jgi:hypothetical protein
MTTLVRFSLAAYLTSATMSAAFGATQLQEELFDKVLGGAKCQQSKNNGTMCEYKIDDLVVSIKDAGGSDTVIGFQHSNISSKYYAVWYFGCVVVVPGNAHVKNYDRDYGVFISPTNGRVYRTRAECTAAR